MKKILMVVNSLHPGGAENFAFSLAEHLYDQYDYHISFAYIRDEDSDLSRAIHVRLSSKFPLFSSGKKPFSGVRGLIRCYKRFSTYVKNENFDLIISQCELPDLFTALLRTKSTRMRVLQNTKTWSENPLAGRIIERILISKRADYNIAVSESVKKAFAEKYGVNPEKTEIIPNGADPLFFEQQKSRIFKKEGFLNVAIVGRLETQKGHRYLFNAARQLKEKINLQVQVIGNGSLEESLRNFVREHKLEKNIIFHGSKTREELILLYSAIDVLVMPSLYEGLPLAAIEAMAMGIPVIGSRVPGIVDCIDESNGLLFEPGNETDLSNKIIELYNNTLLHEQLSRNAIRSAQLYAYSWIAGKYHEVIKKLLNTA